MHWSVCFFVSIVAFVNAVGVVDDGKKKKKVKNRQ